MKRLLKLLFIVLLTRLSFQTLYAQAPVKLRSTIGISGSSKTFTSKGHNYYLVQSIGQSSVIGLSRYNQYMLRQGFIQPLNSSIPVIPLDIMKAEVFPNPFSAFITITFAEDVSDILYVTLIDLSGKISYLKLFPAAQEIKLNVESLAPSIYFLMVRSTTKCFYTKLIKI